MRMIAYTHTYIHTYIHTHHQEGALPSLITLLRHANEKIQELAVLSIRNISTSDDNKIKIVRLGGLPPLIGILRSTNMRVVEQAAGTLWSLSVRIGMIIYMSFWCDDEALTSALSACVCVCVYIYIHTYIYHTYIHVCMNECMYVCMCKCRPKQSHLLCVSLQVSEENQLKIVQEDGLQLLIGLLRSPNENVVEQVCMCVFVYTHKLIHTYACTNIYICMYVCYIYIYILVRVCIHTHKSTHSYTYMQILICIYTRHTRTHTHTYTSHIHHTHHLCVSTLSREHAHSQTYT